MRRLAKAPSAESTSGAGARSVALSFFVLAALLIVLATAGSASAAMTHPFKETFGSAAQPAFVNAEGLAVDQSSGDLLVIDAEARTLSRYNPDGTPAKFAALSTNVIDGSETPQGELSFGGPGEVQVAVDNSGGVTAGNIYLTQPGGVLDIFAADGHYLGQLTEFESGSGPTPFAESCGVAVDPNGNVYSGDFSRELVHKFSPAANPPVTADNVANFSAEFVCEVAAGAGPTTGSIFAATYFGPIQKLDSSSGTVDYVVAPGANTTLTVNPGNGRVLAASEGVVTEYDASGGSGATQTSTLTAPSLIQAVAVNGVSGDVYIARAGSSTIEVFGPPVIVPTVTAGAASEVTRTKATLNGSVNPENVAVTACEFEYLTQADFEANGNSYTGPNSPLTHPCEGSIPTDSTDHQVTAALTGLVPNVTTYHFRLRATNANGSSVSGDETFVTGASVVTGDATGNSGTKAILNGSVFPDNATVTECKFEYGTTTSYANSSPCAEAIPADEDEHSVTAALTNLQPNGTTYHFRLVVVTGGGTANGADRSFTTPDTVVTGAASALTDSSATVGGTVNADGVPLTNCEFEYGPTTAYGSSQACVPAAGSIPADSTPHAVSAELTGLDENATYHFRLVAVNGNGPISGADTSFTTQGAPRISEEVPAWVDKTTATLQAKINPSGRDTTYHFEWGTDGSYGNRVPLSGDPSIGSGTAPVVVNADLSGLQQGTEYKFRVVATNSTGETRGAGQSFETLNACGLIQDRCFELVSPPDKGPAGTAGSPSSPVPGMLFQVSPDGSKIAYKLGYGLPDATTGGEVFYLAERGATEWSSRQLSPPSTEPSITAGQFNTSSVSLLNSADLNCGFVVTNQRLTPDSAAIPVAEAGGANLYRYDASGYTLVSNLPAVDPSAAGINWTDAYLIAGASTDCRKVVFQTPYKYPGVNATPSASGLGFFEWDQGVLRAAGVVPGPIGPEVAPNAAPGGGETFWRSVSDDGSKVFFTAPSQVGGDLGKAAIFARENGAASVDISQSQTSTRNNGAVYQTASSDGSRVFFLANYGLVGPPLNGFTFSDCTLNESQIFNQQCDLYEYDFNKPLGSRLANLSASVNPADTNGAEVAGVLDTSADGSYVYFAARGQLVPDKGNTYAENESRAAYNIYLSHSGVLNYVATVARAKVSLANDGLLVASYKSSIKVQSWTSRATPDGKHLLFQSASNVTGYDSGGVSEAYLYSADSKATVCISCRRDGLVSVGDENTLPLLSGALLDAVNRWYQPINISGDGSRVFFRMPDALAPGAHNGKVNLYEWHEGQVSLLSTNHAGVPNALFDTNLAGASANGDSVFFRTKRSLVPQDTDQQEDIYVARVGGGFAPPPPPAAPCDPLSESSCLEAEGAGGGSPSAPASSTFSETAQPKPKKCKSKPKKCAKSKKCKKRPKKCAKPKHHKRTASNHGRAAK